MYSNKNSVVFPGQGSQYPQMLSHYFEKFLAFQETFELSSKLLGTNFIDLIQKGNNEELSKTEVTQPLMLIANVALWNLVKEKIDKPVCLAGHSLGEYSALVASKVLDFKDALMLVQERSTLMQEAVPHNEGGIAAIVGLDEETINTVCTRISRNLEFLVSTANLNSPTQIVISGTKLGVLKAIDEFKLLGARRAINLPMSVPAHSNLMKEAARKFSLAVKKVQFNDPKIPIILNVDGKAEEDVEMIKVKLIKQIYNPVRWLDTVNLINRMGVKTIIECGPGKVLCGLIKRISPEITVIDLDNYENFLNLTSD